MPESTPVPSHERTDISARGAAWFALALVVSVAVIGIIVAWMHARLNHSGPAWPHQPTAERPLFPAPSPALQSLPAEEWKALQELEEQKLGNYAW